MRCAIVALVAGLCACSAPDPVRSSGPTGAPAVDGGTSSGGNGPGPAMRDPCAGLMPTLPPPQTFTVAAADGGGLWCSGAATDGAGNVYVLGYFGGIRNIAGVGIGGHIFFQPLASGFTAFRRGMSPSTTYSTWTSDGRQIASVPVMATTTLAGVRANGGTILVGCGSNDSAVAQEFDDAGALTIVPLMDQRCFESVGGGLVVDAQDRILIVRVLASPSDGVPSGHYAARWFSIDGMPLTGWFDAGAASSTRVFVSLRALIGGGAVLRAGGAVAEWPAAFVSGTTIVRPAPAFLPPDSDLRVVRGGNAYAVLTSSYNHPVGAVELFAPGGQSCGTVATNQARRDDGSDHSFFIGKDGTLIDQAGVAFGYHDCLTTWYPQALE